MSPAGTWIELSPYPYLWGPRYGCVVVGIHVPILLLRDPPAVAVHILSVSFSSYLKIWREFGATMLGTGWDIVGLREQNEILVIDTIALC